MCSNRMPWLFNPNTVIAGLRVCRLEASAAFEDAHFFSFRLSFSPTMSYVPMREGEINPDLNEEVYLPIIKKVKMWRKAHEDAMALMFADQMVARLKVEGRQNESVPSQDW